MKVYLDHAATTPPFPAVIEAMTDYLQTSFGNPSSLHSFGREAKEHLTKARAAVGALINAPAEEIFFTSGGTESDNLAILGSAAVSKNKKHLITSSAEHHAALDACLHLQKVGYELTVLDVDEYGMVKPEALKKALREDTFLVSIMQANNEIGTINPIKELTELAHQAGALVHIDAVQSVGKIEVDVIDLGVDMLTYSAHKINGPKGVGALYKRRGLSLQRLAYGGGQEKKVRSGTENMLGIVGFGAAAAATQQNWRKDAQESQKLRDHFIQQIQANIPETHLNGHPTIRLPHNVNISFNYIEGEALLERLDLHGIACSAGSACSSGSFSPSHVLSAMALDDRWLNSAVRFSLGYGVTAEQISYTLDVLQKQVQQLRDLSPFYQM